MKIKQNIHIIGGSLYGCLLAYFFSGKKKYEVYIIENSGNLINSLNPISLNNMKLNNGYHVFELPRSQELLNFMMKKIKIKFNYFNNKKKISINKYLINSNAKLIEWPDKIKEKVSIKKNYYDDKQNLNQYFKTDLVKLIKKNSERFTDKFEQCKGYFLPYFLPADIVHKSKNRGMILRDLIKRSKIKSSIAVPKKFLFASIQKPIQKILRKRGVKILFNTSVSFKNKKIEYSNKEKKIDLINKNTKKIFFCMSSAIMLKDIDRKYLKNIENTKRFFYNCLVKINSKEKKLDFSEILCLNSKLPWLNRISSPSNFLKSKEKCIQIEIISKEKLNFLKIKKDLLNEIKKILLLRHDPKFKESKITRVIFTPDKLWTKKGVIKCKKWILNYENKIVSKFDFFPVNMNQTWFYAKEDYKKYY